MHRSNLKRWLAVTSLALLTSLAQAGVGPRSKCDNEQSRLCDGLVAVYEFEEGLSSGSTPTYPDAVRRNSFGAGDLYEPNAIDVGAGSTQVSPGVNNGKLGQGSVTYSQPSDFSGLKLWLKADALTGLNDGDAVTTFTDSSGLGNNFSQATGSAKPTYKVGIQNGNPALQFDGSADYMTGPLLSSLISTTAQTTFVVLKSTQAGAARHALGDGESSGTTISGINQTAAGNIAAYSNDGTLDIASRGYSANLWNIVTSIHDGGNIKVGLDDTRTASLTSTASGTMGALNFGAYLGNDFASLFWKGYIAEVIIYNVALSETDRQKAESYLSNKYAITVPYEHVGGAGAGDDQDAAEFDGTSHYLHTGLDGRGSGVLGNSYWTVAFWVYPDNAGITGQDQVIWSENGRQNGAPRLGTEIEFNNDGTKFFPRVRVYDGLTEAATTASWGSNVTTGTWHLVVVSFRPRTIFTNGELSISVDGGTEVSVAISSNGGIMTGVGSIIGRRANVSDPDFFDGRLDQLAIAGIKWLPADISAFWNGGAGREFPFVGN